MYYVPGSDASDVVMQCFSRVNACEGGYKVLNESHARGCSFVLWNRFFITDKMVQQEPCSVRL